MGRATIVISNEMARHRAVRWVGDAPIGTRVTFKASKRTLPQNDKMWSMLTSLSAQLEWHGQKLSTNDWKLLFMDALKRELRVVPNIEGSGVVSIGRSSSELSKEEMSDVIELIFKFGAVHDVTFQEVS